MKSSADGRNGGAAIRAVLTVALVAAVAVVAYRAGRHPVSSPSSSSVPAPRYHCPMHPAVVSDRPGTCPICNMDLVEIASGHVAPDGGGMSGLAPVTVPPEVRDRLGLKLGTVERRTLEREIRAPVRIVPDERLLTRVSTKVEGWIDELFVPVTCQSLTQGEPLLSIYSPELVSAQSEYLAVLGETAAGLESADAAARSAARDMRDMARRRLLTRDVSASQIAAIEKAGRPDRAVTLYAPAGGVVLEKSVLAGQKVSPGEPLFLVADLRRVWADADLYPPDLPDMRTGLTARVTVSGMPGVVFTGAVTFVGHVLAPATRTALARLEIDNVALALRPGLFGDARIQVPLGESLAVPETAVMRTGERVYAFRDEGDGRLAPTPIRIGRRAGGWYEVSAGLAEGDRVVVSANFLIDSESSLRAALEPAGETR